MEAKKELYTDGIGQIHFVGGMVKIDMVTLEPGHEDGKPPVPVEKFRIITTPQGFLNSFSAMQQLIGKLEQAGVIKRNDNQA